MRILSSLLLIGILAGATMAFVPSLIPEKPKSKVPQFELRKYRLVQDEFKKLGTSYCISYGNENAPIKIIEFFSFQCPYCIKLFKDEFETIKQKLIDTGKVNFVFHPVPQDLPTVQALICLEKLEEQEKRLFLEVLFEEAVPSDPELMSKLMMTAMDVFKKPIPQLDDHDFIQENKVFGEVYNFLKQEKILAVPTVEINGRLYASDVPDYQFIKSFIED